MPSQKGVIIMTLGEKIQDLRRRSAMSQDALAEKLEVSRQAVSKWERDEAMPETDKIVHLARLFGVSTDQLLLDEPIPPVEPVQMAAPSRTERFIRRHGYKAGYGLIAWGAVLCVVALVAMIALPCIFSAVFQGSGYQMDFEFGNSIVDAYYQDVQWIQNTFLVGVRLMTLFAGIPMALAGITLVVFGIVVVVKGKKLAKQSIS
jgi:transcriptional regulator with XRE-family HTH domain